MKASKYSHLQTVHSTLVIAALLLVSIGSSWARTFTNRDGKQIKAEVTAVRQGQVFLVMNDREFAVPFSSLSDADQQYLREWVDKNIDYNLTIEAEAVEKNEARLSRDLGNLPNNGKLPGSYSGTTSTSGGIKAVESWNFEVTITNRTRVALPEAIVHYMVIVRDDKRGRPRNEHDLIRYSGYTNLETIPSMERTTWSTPTMLLREIEWVTITRDMLPDGAVEERVTKYQRKGFLELIWIKVYVGDRKVADWISRGNEPDELSFVYLNDFQHLADMDKSVTFNDRFEVLKEILTAFSNQSATEQQRKTYSRLRNSPVKLMEPPKEPLEERSALAMSIAASAPAENTNPAYHQISDVTP